MGVDARATGDCIVAARSEWLSADSFWFCPGSRKTGWRGCFLSFWWSTSHAARRREAVQRNECENATSSCNGRGRQSGYSSVAARSETRGAKRTAEKVNKANELQENMNVVYCPRGVEKSGISRGSIFLGVRVRNNTEDYLSNSGKPLVRCMSERGNPEPRFDTYRTRCRD